MIKKPQVNITHLFIAFLLEDLKHFQFSERNNLWVKDRNVVIKQKQRCCKGKMPNGIVYLQTNYAFVGLPDFVALSKCTI